MPPCSSELLDNPINRDKVRTIYLSRHGESENNLFGRIGGDADLSSRGEQYARALGYYINTLPQPCHKVITSRLHRTQQTAQYVQAQKEIRHEIDEINSGEHDNMTYEDIAANFPVEFALRDRDKLNYRYPKGESYMDVVKRLKPMMAELELEDNILIISHQATLRCMLTCLLEGNLAELPYLKIPLHTIIKLTISDAGVSMEYHRIPVECVDTFRPKPENCEISRNLAAACQTVPFHL
ncbi:6-phosphofructo-2-kinase/fructose-2,6-bisphosphatase [Eurytemora carolleeae]|uniref:6-phosphofructo-2-kinase/fructose-2, 6-bisphosphatase n=1 Tax=Eurytemora carolleeae TaxID=1294199 RepID=UPI000C757B59|nr:6-phosphofructo-2-kinase/fructose-2,6-bisphosphatase [Eurytemora carolleeae]|eukprot:XP_023343168.1 6-phosphofructo-2-kinase/fructose-2,6-bisphosphatase-like [Eurytemora affinis]